MNKKDVQVLKGMYAKAQSAVNDCEVWKSETHTTSRNAKVWFETLKQKNGKYKTCVNVFNYEKLGMTVYWQKCRYWKNYLEFLKSRYA